MQIPEVQRSLKEFGAKEIPEKTYLLEENCDVEVGTGTTSKHTAKDRENKSQRLKDLCRERRRIIRDTSAGRLQKSDQ